MSETHERDIDDVPGVVDEKAGTRVARPPERPETADQVDVTDPAVAEGGRVDPDEVDQTADRR